MDLESISKKHLNELELHVRELLSTMRKAKLQNDILKESLMSLEKELGDVRRGRFDKKNTEYHTY